MTRSCCRLPRAAHNRTLVAASPSRVSHRSRSATYTTRHAFDRRPRRPRFLFPFFFYLPVHLPPASVLPYPHKYTYTHYIHTTYTLPTSRPIVHPVIFPVAHVSPRYYPSCSFHCPCCYITTITTITTYHHHHHHTSALLASPRPLGYLQPSFAPSGAPPCGPQASQPNVNQPSSPGQAGGVVRVTFILS
jgi:hypothetical protein